MKFTQTTKIKIPRSQEVCSNHEYKRTHHTMKSNYEYKEPTISGNHEYKELIIPESLLESWKLATTNASTFTVLY